MRIAADVADALTAGQPVVALESTLLAHGLPRPDNLRIAHRIADQVRAAGAVPATIALLDGQVRIGLDAAELERVCTSDAVTKLSARDLPVAMARGVDGATTVASTALLAARAGIGVFATGGLGGVHRFARDSWDESADLVAISRTPVVVVCAGVKSILDVAATLERLESLSVPVLGWRSNRFPGFYLTDSGFTLDWRVDSAAEVAAIAAAHHELGGGGIVVANPLPESQQLDPALHDAVLSSGLAGLEHHGVRGKAVTPYLLDHFHRATGGASRDVNVALVLRNARLAAELAVAMTP